MIQQKIQILKEILEENQKEIFSQDLNDIQKVYNYGLVNGLIYSIAMLTDTEPEFMKFPENLLQTKKTKRKSKRKK